MKELETETTASSGGVLKLLRIVGEDPIHEKCLEKRDHMWPTPQKKKKKSRNKFWLWMFGLSRLFVCWHLCKSRRFQSKMMERACESSQSSKNQGDDDIKKLQSEAEMLQILNCHVFRHFRPNHSSYGVLRIWIWNDIWRKFLKQSSNLQSIIYNFRFAPPVIRSCQVIQLRDVERPPTPPI